MKYIAQLIINKDAADHLTSILDEHKVKNHQLNAFTTDTLNDVILILDHLPWTEIAAIIASFLGYKARKHQLYAKRKVVISYPDNSVVDITGYSLKEIEQINHIHKQLYISMCVEKNEKEND